MSAWPQLLSVFALWLGYFFIHSYTASLSVKQSVQRRLGISPQSYRLGYNVVATILLLPLIYLIWQDSTPILWQRHGWLRYGFNAIALLAVLGFLLTARDYDMKAFLGLATEAQGADGFRISWLHRYVRHPWYFFALLIIWTRDMSALWLLSCICISVYLIIGSRLEDKKLERQYGAAYTFYRQRVPGLLMIPGRYLSRAAMQRLASLKNT